MPLKTLPDYSILRGFFVTEKLKVDSITSSTFKNPTTKEKRNLTKLNYNTFFLSQGIHSEVLDTINKVEYKNMNQAKVDTLW